MHVLRAAGTDVACRHSPDEQDPEDNRKKGMTTDGLNVRLRPSAHAGAPLWRSCFEAREPATAERKTPPVPDRRGAGGWSEAGGLGVTGITPRT